MRSFICPRFVKEYRALPKAVRIKARKAYSFFKINPRYPSLHFKPVISSIGLYSARADKNYRALGAVSSENEIMWFWIGPHDEYMRKINDPNIVRSVEMARERLADRRPKR